MENNLNIFYFKINDTPWVCAKIVVSSSVIVILILTCFSLYLVPENFERKMWRKENRKKKVEEKNK